MKRFCTILLGSFYQKPYIAYKFIVLFGVLRYINVMLLKSNLPLNFGTHFNGNESLGITPGSS